MWKQIILNGINFSYEIDIIQRYLAYIDEGIDII